MHLKSWLTVDSHFYRMSHKPWTNRPRRGEHIRESNQNRTAWRCIFAGTFKKIVGLRYNGTNFLLNGSRNVDNNGASCFISIHLHALQLNISALTHQQSIMLLFVGLFGLFLPFFLSCNKSFFFPVVMSSLSLSWRLISSNNHVYDPNHIAMLPSVIFCEFLGVVTVFVLQKQTNHQPIFPKPRNKWN